MQIKSLEIHNILSIADAKIEFEDTGMVLVEGWNHDDDTANGAGKTSIFNSLAFGLYGKAPRKISASEFLKDNEKSGYVKVVVQSVDSWTVIRSRPNKVEFQKNSLTVDITQEEFEKHIGLNYNQFLVSMYNAQVEGKSFLYLNDSGKKEFLLQLLNLEDFTDAKKLADDKSKALQKQIDEFNSNISAMQSRIGAYTESLVDVAIITTQIELNNSKIAEYEQEILTLNQLTPPDVSKYVEYEQKISIKRQKISDAKAKISYIDRQNRTLQNSIKLLEHGHDEQPSTSCPHCDKSVIVVGSNLQKADSLEAHKSAKAAKLLSLRDEAVSVTSELESLLAIVAKEPEINALENKFSRLKNDEMMDFNSASRKLIELKSTVANLKGAVQNALKEISRSTELKTKIDNLNQQISQLTTQIDCLTADQDFLKAAAALFAPTGAPAYIMDSIVDAFNEAVEGYVTLVWPNAKYRLLSYKESSSGVSVAKFSEELIINGRDKSIGSLSGGEQRCLSLAVDFAIIDVLSNRYSIAINPMVMDEPFTGLDTCNRERVIDLIEKLAVDRQIWIIDHCNESKAMFSKVVKVEKRNGSSTII
jgi:DNA repair exonuclease SbcCD ATPase subunit